MASTKGKVIKCRAAVAWEPNKPISIEQIEVAPPKKHEIRVKIVATGLCRTDLSGWKAILPLTRFPTILGHEAAGVVESIGEGVTSVKEGDHVLSSFLPSCNDCSFCKDPDTNLCEKFIPTPETIGRLRDRTTRFTCKGKEVYHYLDCSTFAEYTVLPEGSFAKINKDAPMEKVCILSCGVTTGFGGPIKAAPVKPGSSCAVFGLGAVGLGAVMGCKIQGAKTIYGIDINNDKKEFAKIFGVTDFVNPKDYDKPIDQVLIEKSQGGVDYTFECLGNAQVMEAALNALHVGSSKCVLLGLTPEGINMTIDPYQLLFGRHITGSLFGGFKTWDTPGLVDDYMNKKILVDEFITHTMPIEDINKAFDYMIQGKSLKSVLTF